MVHVQEWAKYLENFTISNESYRIPSNNSQEQLIFLLFFLHQKGTINIIRWGRGLNEGGATISNTACGKLCPKYFI